MKRSHVVAAAAVLLFTGAAHAFRARTLAEYQNVKLVATFEAEALEGAADAAQEDKVASGGKAVRLADRGTRLSFTRELDAGSYGVWLYARVPGSEIEGPWPPVYVWMTVTDPAGRTSLSRQRVPYRPIYQVVTQLFFIAHQKGAYRVELSVDKLSTSPLLLDFVELRDELAGLELKPVKQARNLVDDATLARIRAGVTQKLGERKGPEELGRLVRQAWVGLPAVNATLSRRLGGLASRAEKLAAQHERDGDPAAAQEAAIILVALAERFPTLNARFQSEAGNFGRVSYERFSQATGGVLPMPELARAYDRIFDEIKDDADLARAVGTMIPFIKTPEDLRAYLDRNLLQYGLRRCFRFSYRTMQMGWEARVSEMLLVLGPNEVGQQWMDRFFRQCYADLTGDGGYQDYLINGVHRDGSNYVGATLYTAAVPVLMARNAMRLERFARLGGRVPRFAYDPAVNPRLLESGHFILSYRAAGGFWPIFGDGGGAIDHRFYPVTGDRRGAADVFRWLFEKTGQRRYAYVARSPERPPEVDDEQWQRIEDAAKDTPDPVLHGDSVVMPGFGATLLELGADETDLKRKGSAVIRFGTGKGHQHGDLLDLTLNAYGRRIISDGGRSGWPWTRFTCQHNTVEVDRHSFQSTDVNSGAYGYPIMMRSVRGARFASAGGWCSIHPDPSDYRRDVAMIDLGVPDDGDAAQRHYYVFDVMRVGGGKVHTYSTHGMVSREVSWNVPDEPAPNGPKSLLYKAGDPRTGVAADPLVTTWRAGRPGPKGNSQPHGLRHHLFGWGDRRFYCGRGRHPNYNMDIPYVWIERESAEPIHDAYASVFEPFYENPNLVSVKALKVTGGGEGSHAARAVQVVSRWGRTDTVVINESGAKVSVEGGLETDGHFAFIAETETRVRQTTLVGGTYLRRGKLVVTAEQAAYEGRIVSYDAKTLALKTAPPLPAKEAAGALVSFGRKPHMTGEYVLPAEGEGLRLRRLPSIFRSPVAAVDEGTSTVSPAIALPLTLAEPRFYEGCTATNEAHDRFWRVERTAPAEVWMPLFTPIREADLTDADGDGKRTVRLTNFAPPELTRDPVIKYYGPFEKPVRMRQYNRPPFKEPVVLEVTRVDEARRILYFKPPEDYDLLWGGWVYESTVLTNEKGDRQWSGNYPGREFRIVLSGAEPPKPAHFTDTATPWGEPPDGERRIFLYDFGPGDPYRLETHVSVQREEDGAVRVERNVASEASM